MLDEALRARIDARLAALLPPPGDPLADAMRHAALGRGQRLRPLLVLLAAHELGSRADDAAALDAGCALELVHAASLALGHAYQIHDDLRDASSDGDRTSHVAALGADGARHALRRRVDAALAELPRRDGPLGHFVCALFA